MKITDQKISSFKPVDFQNDFDVTKVIVKDTPNAEAVPMDVLFVGAGPAGLSGAIELTKLVQKERESNPSFPEIQIGVLEKASGLGEVGYDKILIARLRYISSADTFVDVKIVNLCADATFDNSTDFSETCRQPEMWASMRVHEKNEKLKAQEQFLIKKTSEN